MDRWPVVIKTRAAYAINQSGNSPIDDTNCPERPTASGLFCLCPGLHQGRACVSGESSAWSMTICAMPNDTPRHTPHPPALLCADTGRAIPMHPARRVFDAWAHRMRASGELGTVTVATYRTIWGVAGLAGHLAARLAERRCRSGVGFSQRPFAQPAPPPGRHPQ